MTNNDVVNSPHPTLQVDAIDTTEAGVEQELEVSPEFLKKILTDLKLNAPTNQMVLIKWRK